jgi:hypothetical protein
MCLKGKIRKRPDQHWVGSCSGRKEYMRLRLQLLQPSLQDKVCS